MVENIINIINSNGVQTILLAAVGCLTWIVYNGQKKDQIKNAAILVKLEIDSIEKAIEKIIGKISFEEIFQSTPIYQKLDWYNLRNLLVTKLDVEQINSINEFYTKVVFIEEARQAFKEAVYLNRTGKIEATQKDISAFLYNQANAIYPTANLRFVNRKNLLTKSLKIDAEKNLNVYINSKLNNFQNFYNNYSRDFIPNGVVSYFDTAKHEFKAISNTPAYETIKKIAKK